MAFQHTFTADGTSPTFTARGYFNFLVNGTFGGGTVSVQINNGDQGWVDLDDSILAIEDDLEMLMHGVNQYRLNLTGSTSPDLDCVITGDVA